MKITCKDCIEKISEYKWVLMTWLMTVIFGVALIFYQNDPKKIAIINLAEKIIVCCLLPALALFKVSCFCCFKTEKEIIMEEGRKILKSFSDDSKAIQDLKELKKGGDKDAEKLLTNIKESGMQTLKDI